MLLITWSALAKIHGKPQAKSNTCTKHIHVFVIGSEAYNLFICFHLRYTQHHGSGHARRSKHFVSTCN